MIRLLGLQLAGPWVHSSLDLGSRRRSAAPATDCVCVAYTEDPAGRVKISGEVEAST